MRRMGSANKKSSASGISTKTRKPRRRSSPQFAVCIENSGYPASLELHKIYRVLPDEDVARDRDLRIVDESGEDYLYVGRLGFNRPDPAPCSQRAAVRAARTMLW